MAPSGMSIDGPDANRPTTSTGSGGGSHFTIRGGSKNAVFTRIRNVASIHCGAQEPAPLGRRFLHFEPQVLVIAIAAPAAEQRPDVAVDRLDHAERDLLVAVGLVAVGQDAVEV